MIEDPKTHFISKAYLALKEISEDSPFLALSFKEKDKRGVIFITKSQNLSIKSKMFNAENDEPIVVCAVGKKLDFLKFCDWFKYLLEEFDTLYGSSNLNTSYLLGQITRYLNEIYLNESRALGIELIFFAVLDGRASMFRIKYDGDYHLAPLFVIISGQNKPSDSKVSLRKKILKELNRIYKTKSPNYKTAKSWGRKLLKLDPKEGEIQSKEVHFKFKT